jgi:hypothetical protein
MGTWNGLAIKKYFLVLCKTYVFKFVHELRSGGWVHEEAVSEKFNK